MNSKKNYRLSLTISIFISFLSYTSLQGSLFSILYNPDHSYTIMYLDSQNSVVHKQLIGNHGLLLQEEALNYNGTTTQTIYRADYSRIITNFDKHRKICSMAVINPNGTIIDKNYNPDHSLNIGYYTANHKLAYRKFIDKKGKFFKKIVHKDDGTIVRIDYHNNHTKKIIHYGTDGNIMYTKLIDALGNVIQKDTYKKNKSIVSTTYNPDASKIIEYCYANNMLQSETYSNAAGKKTHASRKLIIACHEAGHAVAAIYAPASEIIYKATIIPNKIDKNRMELGCVQFISMPTHNKDKDELENSVIIDLSGGVAEQLLFNKPMLTSATDVARYFQRDRYKNDIKGAYKTIQALLAYHYCKDNNIPQTPTTITPFLNKDTMLLALYQKSYQLLLEKKKIVKNLAQTLIKEKELSGDEVYRLVDQYEKLHQSCKKK